MQYTGKGRLGRACVCKDAHHKRYVNPCIPFALACSAIAMMQTACDDDSKKSGGQDIQCTGENCGKPCEGPNCSPIDNDGCKDGEKFIIDACYDQSTCDPVCSGEQVCKNGRCYYCTDSKCYLVNDDPGQNETCVDRSTCKDGEECVQGHCAVVADEDCDPKCNQNEICVNHQCKSQTLLWTLCRNDGDCGVGKCLFYLKPSHQMTYQGVTYGTEDNTNIPVGLLDSRINAAYYNRTHQNKADSGDEIGICSMDCTRDADACGANWTCQVVLKGDSPYPKLKDDNHPDNPDAVSLPFELPASNMETSGFSAICRPKMTQAMVAETPYDVQFCSKDDSGCEASGNVFYKGECLASCDAAGFECPYAFTCTEIDQSGKKAKVCMPIAATCGACYDNDGDGSGYGHCPKPGVDCNEDDPNIYYGKALSCDDIINNEGNTVYEDHNCNGIIDYYELVGTMSNCARCGNDCPVPAPGKGLDVVCAPVDASVRLDKDWYKTANADTVVPEFYCKEQCAFGYGNCDGKAACQTELLNSEARAAAGISEAYKDNIHASWVIASSKSASLYIRDNDDDGYPTVSTASSKNEGELILDKDNTLVCCGSETINGVRTCYTANQNWTSTTIPADDSYIKVADNRVNDLAAYDIDDADSAVNPSAVEICDGKDNDGSRIVLKDDATACSEWCAKPENDCRSFAVQEGSKVVGFKTNAYCDATQDGLRDNPLMDTVEQPPKSHALGEYCSIYNDQNVVCDNAAVVQCRSQVVTQDDGSTTNEWSLQCVGGGNGSVDGRDASGKPEFNGMDEDCDGLVDEDAWVPCVITNTNLPWDASSVDVTGLASLKDGIANPVDYIVYSTALGYEDKALPKNADGSFNLCSLGILQSRSIEQPDGSVDIQPFCMPLYQPRENDYYGDGIDSNCDGADYDMVHARFVGVAGQSLAADTGRDCGYCYAGKDDGAPCDKKNTVAPCATFNRAIESARNADGSYNDIFVEDAEFTYNMDFKTLGDYPSPMTLPNNSKQVPPLANLVPDATGLADVPNHIKDGHFISVFGLHHFLVSQKKDIPDFKANLYLFSYETVTTNEATHVTEYLPAGMIEQKRPEEVIRIYGGFSRDMTNAKCTQPTGCDYWEADGTSKITWNVKPDGAKNYSMVGPSKVGEVSPLSLRLNNLELIMQPASGAVSDRSMANGMTFIGINGSLKSRILSLQNTSVNVKGIDGYSFAVGDRPNKGMNGKPELSACTPDTCDTNCYHKYGGNNWWCSDQAAYYTGGCNDYCDKNTELFIKDYNNNSFFTKHIVSIDNNHNSITATEFPSATCGYGTDGIQSPSYGGMGGWTATWDEPRHDGKGGSYPYIYENGTWVMRTDYGSLVGAGGVHGNRRGECGSDCLNSEEKNWGKPGKGGRVGKPGDSQKIRQYFALDNHNGLYVDSDRSQGRGWYGDPGGGGGGGGIVNCWRDASKFKGYCRAASGGRGGCGGQGGEAGGTGGSALGIVLSSSPDNADTTVLRLNNSATTVTNGNGGKQQLGADGGAGGGAFNKWSFAWREDISRVPQACHSAAGAGAGGGGGAGGVGAGGRPGWAYPYVMLCHSDSNDAQFSDVTELSNLARCKFDIDSNVKNSGTQQMSGMAYKDAAPFSDNTGKGQDAVMVNNSDLTNDTCQSTFIFSDKYGTSNNLRAIGYGGSIMDNQHPVNDGDKISVAGLCQLKTPLGDYKPIIVKPVIHNTTDGTVE